MRKRRNFWLPSATPWTSSMTTLLLNTHPGYRLALRRCGKELDGINVPSPIPATVKGYAEGNHLDYWLSGYADHRMVQGIAAEYGVKGGRYFDFGGSTGRVFRNFALQTDAWDVWS